MRIGIIGLWETTGTMSDASVAARRPGDVCVGTVKLSLLAALALVCLIPGAAPSQHQHQRPSPASSPLRRLRRGWIWKQLFVPEEDPSPQVIGQVAPQVCGLFLVQPVCKRPVPLQLRSDSDRGDSSIRYILSGEGAGDVFQIDEYSGEIRTLRKLDREEKASYVLQAQAINRRSSQPEEPQSEFIITVQDINDNVPQFQNEPYQASIPEMCPLGTWIHIRNSDHMSYLCCRTPPTPAENKCP